MTPMSETKIERPILQQRMMADLGLTDADFAYHESDLYVVETPAVWEWLRANYAYNSQCRAFNSQEGSGWNGAGKRGIDIPFAAGIRRLWRS